MLLQRALFLFSCIAASCDGFIPNNKLEAPQIVSPVGGGTRTRFSSSSSSKSSSSTTRPRIIQSRELFQVATITTIKASSSAAAADVMPSSSLSVYDSPLLSSRKNKNNNSNNDGAVNKKEHKKKIGKIQALATKVGMMAFIVSMCLALPIALLPNYVLYKMGFINRVQKEHRALQAGQFCARWLMFRLIPFCSIRTIPYHDPNPEPSIWVCNHVSALDIFVLLAADKKLRGANKRPMKIIYWKQLEDNPITKLLFTQCGFIPVQMAANKAGEANDYDLKSFKSLLKSSKQAFEEGFDIGILPEGQLNPHPEQGLLPCFSGAYTLAKMSKRPIQMMALHGTHQLWHAQDDIGMTITGRNVQVRCYPTTTTTSTSTKGENKQKRMYQSGEEFLATFNAVVGEFGTKGKDLDDKELKAWLDGTKWQEQQQRKHQKQQEVGTGAEND